MEYQKITNLLGSTSDKVPRFIIKKWIEVHDQSRGVCSTNKQIRFKASMLRSDLCDYFDAYIVVKGIITVSAAERDRDEKNRQVTLKNNAPFISCISKINGTLIENAEDLDIVMPIYNLLKYSKNYLKTFGSLWNYYRGELADEANDNNNPNKNVINSKSFKYKTSITENTFNGARRITDAHGNLANNPDYVVNKRGTKEVEIAVPLKYLGNFRYSLNIPLANCEVSLALSWSATCVITSTEKRILAAGQSNRGGSPTNATFKITDIKMYVPVVTLSAEMDNKLLEQLKIGFKRTIKWNKYRSEMSNQARNNNLNYLTDPTFTNLNRLFALSFEHENDRISFSKYYLPKIEIKHFNVLIDGKPFFEIPIKNKEAYEAVIEMSKNNDYTTGNLLDYEYFKDHYKLIVIDLSKQTELENTDLKNKLILLESLKKMQQYSLLLRKNQKLLLISHKLLFKIYKNGNSKA